ncbi:MAG: hypothetical protein R3E77_06650 [Steroidobacteraceae bacterium]
MIDRRRLVLGTALLAIAMGGAASAQAGKVVSSEDLIQAALARPSRPADDHVLDTVRHPTEVLAFAQVRPGEYVVDLGPGTGYYTRLFSNIVGPTGHVYAVTDAHGRPASAEQGPIYQLERDPEFSNVDVLSEGWAFRRRHPLDLIFVSQIYHDFHVTSLQVNPHSMVALFFRSLRPGGALVIIDHSAPEDPDQDTIPNRLHRIDPAIVRREVEAAGFRLEAESEALRNPSDSRTVNVFDPSIRFRTDQFMLRFRKPD